MPSENREATQSKVVTTASWPFSTGPQAPKSVGCVPGAHIAA